MKRFLLAIIIFFASLASADAAHIKGGFYTYRFLGPGSGSNLRYQITLTVYMICSPSSGQLSNPINFSIFDGGNGLFLQNISVPITNQYTLGKIQDEPCITGNQIGCYYTVVIYELPSIELPSTANGYTISYQRCCRIAGINNLVNSGAVGNTFTIDIPGTSVGQNAETNSSPVFPINDTAVVCHNSYFQYSFQATDIDGDSLSYSFCDAYTGADQNTPAPTQATNPPYQFVPYQSPFSGSQPMGPGVTINPITGMISGIAPSATGEYVLCVCVNEYRNGVLIAKSRKELHVVVGDCEALTPDVNPLDRTCDGFTRSFQNANTNPLINSYFWDFGVPILTNDTSILANPTWTYTDTGVYVIKLIVNKGQQCSDSATKIIRVYPNFFPGFNFTGSCITNPFQFTDISTFEFGAINSWSWNFGDATTFADTSHLQNPQWTYSTPGPKTVTLIVGNDKGCIDTAIVNVNVLDRPPITLAFRDTLICIPDALTLNAGGTGVFSWTPPVSIINANTATPTVNPTTSTWYYVNLNDNGCQNRDSVHVRVTSGVNLLARPDTTICLGDPVQLSAVTNGLSFQWTNAATLSNPTIINPIATPVSASTTYQLLASIGSCSAVDDVTIFTVPYPVANAGPDQIICYNGEAQLNGNHNGIQFSWSPTSYLNNPNILNPISSPPRTTTYVLTVYDNKGCPKPGHDTVVINVLPKVRAYAGRDTSVVVGQPLQLGASGGTSYLWIPATFLNNNTIQNPIATFPNPLDSFKYKLVAYNIAGCADTASITVRVYAVNPTVFVPTAFTPNGDGLNDAVRPICVGIRRIIYFSVYNRWGQLVFTTTEDRKGWDGRISGVLQSSNVFVWMVKAEDYLGNKVFLKGTVALIR